MQKLRLLLLLLAPAMPLMAQTTLAGKIGNMTLDSMGSPYIIIDNMTVPFGKTLKIEEGVILLFKPYTGLIIEGSLVVEGLVEKPVIFTTENDARYNFEAKQQPNPFDWNGLLITRKAGLVKLANFILEYSVYGVKSQKEEIVISNGIFVYNGQFQMTIKDTIKNVVDNIPFNFGKEPVTNPVTNPEPSGLYTRNEPGSAIPRFRKPAGIGLGAVGLAAAGVGGYFFYLTGTYNSQYTTAGTQGNAQEKADEYSSKRNTSLTTGVACAIGGGVSIIGGIILFTRHPAKAKNVTIAPIFGKHNGVSIVFNY